MATIHHLNTSISKLPISALYDKLRDIRTQRRIRPSKKIRAKSAPKRTKLPKDPFAIITTMTNSQKTALLKSLKITL